jgi:hypothetical protein
MGGFSGVPFLWLLSLTRGIHAPRPMGAREVRPFLPSMQNCGQAKKVTMNRHTQIIG